MAALPAPEEFRVRRERLRGAGVLRLDLTEPDPARCGLGVDAGDVAAPAAAGSASSPDSRDGGLAEAREAVASYLAGHRVSVAPDRVFLAPSHEAAIRLALGAVCDADGEVLVPAPARVLAEPEAIAPGLRPRTYELEFAESWRLARRSVRRAIGPRTRAVLVGNPAAPTGAMLSGDELAFLEQLCGDRGVALIGDEAFLDTAAGPSDGVGRAARCLAVHVSGLSGPCGLSRPGAAWVALAGPDALVARAASRLAALSAGPVPPSTLRAVPALLARRAPYLQALRARLARNRGAIAAASLREAPWTLQRGAGGCWAVLQINPVRDDLELCLALLDEGVAVQPGRLDGFPPTGHVVVSLLPGPETFREGLERLEAHLRGLA